MRHYQELAEYEQYHRKENGFEQLTDEQYRVESLGWNSHPWRIQLQGDWAIYTFMSIDTGQGSVIRQIHANDLDDALSQLTTPPKI